MDDISAELEHESFEEAGYAWDFVFVLPIPQKQGSGEVKKALKCKYEPNEVIQTLQNAGLQTYLYRSAQQDEIICKVRASVRRRGEDEESEDEDEVGLNPSSDAYLDKKYLIRPIVIPHDPKVTELRPFQFLYAPYDTGKCLERNNPYVYHIVLVKWLI